jgi:hypothetical protein
LNQRKEGDFRAVPYAIRTYDLSRQTYALDLVAFGTGKDMSVNIQN